MFTGLVEEVGEITAVELSGSTARIAIRAPRVYAGARIGDSVAVNGCCLTVTEVAGDVMIFDAVPQTLSRTNLGALAPGGRVNLERPLAADARLGGHFVQGHIDGVGRLVSATPVENAVVLEISLPPELRRYVVAQGSIAVDGVSLTVADVLAGSFTVWTIPHTRAVTTLGERQAGDAVNLECDLLGKYVERLLESRA